MTRIVIFIGLLSICSYDCFAKQIPKNPYVFDGSAVSMDWRAFENGHDIMGLDAVSLPKKYGYMEGLGQFKVNDQVWLQTLTVARSREGNPTQHIIAKRSMDGGNTWSDWFEVEPEGPPMTTYGNFFRHPKTDRIYFMYLRGPDENMHWDKRATDHLGKATFLGWFDGEPFRCYPHLIGKIVYRYVNEKGEFSERHVLDFPVSDIDRSTIFKGKYFVIWGMPTPRVIKGDDAISWCTKHGPIPRTGNGESFFVVYKNYVNNDNLEELEIELIPNSGQGITHPDYSNAGGFSPIIMEEDYWCFKYRTIHGFVGLANSRDQGQTWTTDILRYNPGGRPIKSPQGPYSFIEDPKGRKFFTYYNISDSGFDKFVGRDLVYLSRVRIKDHRFYFSQPELFHYRQDQLGYLNDSHKRLNPPHFIKKDDGVLCRVSDKEFLKEFRMPMTFLDVMDRQSTIREIPQNGLVFKEKNPKPRLNLPLLPNPLNNGGFTISFTIELKNSPPYKSMIMQNGHAGKGVKILTGKNQDLLFVMNDGKQEVSLTSDAGVLKPGQKHAVSIIVDGYPDLVSMVVDERFQDGGTEKYRGTNWFDHDFSDVNTKSEWTLSDDENIVVSSLYVHDRFLLTTEAIGLQRMME